MLRDSLRLLSKGLINFLGGLVVCLCHAQLGFGEFDIDLQLFGDERASKFLDKALAECGGNVDLST